MSRAKHPAPPNVSLLPLEHPSRLADLAYSSLKETILNADYASEARLDERELARNMKISRTPLRDAINRLVSEGFLRVEPRKGVFILRKTRQEMSAELLARLSEVELETGRGRPRHRSLSLPAEIPLEHLHFLW